MKDLKQAAEKWISENANSCDFIGEAVAERAFLAGAEWHAHQFPWISVKEDLPCNHGEYYPEEKNQILNYTINVLAMDAVEGVVCAFMRGHEWICSEDSVLLENVIAWMPIPEYNKADSK